MIRRPTKRKLSHNDMARKLEHTVLSANEMLDRCVSIITIERLHAEIHKEVNRQAASGEITKHELMQWRLKWNAYEQDRNIEPAQLAHELSLEHLQKNYVDIFNKTSQQVGDLMTAFYITLEQSK